MTDPQSSELPERERRQHPRFFVTSRITLAVEDESLRESLGLGEPEDISLGGIRVRNLPSCPDVKIGDRLGFIVDRPRRRADVTRRSYSPLHTRQIWSPV